MPRPRCMSKEKLERFCSCVTKDRMTPKELSVAFGVTLNTVYTYLRMFNLPTYKTGDYRKFFNPEWELPKISLPSGVTLQMWGPWVSTERVPKDEAHPSVVKAVGVPLAALILAEHHFRRIPNLLMPCVKFKDGNPNNVVLENLEIDLTKFTDTSDLARTRYIQEIAAREKEMQ